LQLAARELSEVRTCFQNLIIIPNITTSSSNRHDELEANQIAELEHFIEISHINIRLYVKQIGTLNVLEMLGGVCILN